MSKKENVVQIAIALAMHTYFDRPGMPRLELFPPVPVQQGNGLRKFCADLVARLGNARIILLEIKELQCETGTLLEFDEGQHASYLRFQEIGVPVGYAYNADPLLAYHADPRPDDWSMLTLSSVNHSSPSLLPHGNPSISQHSTLLEWLKDDHGEDVSEQLGQVHGVFRRADSLRNGVLVLLHSIDENVLTQLTPDELEDVFKCLDKGSWLAPAQQQRLKKILGASSQVFNDFTSPPLKKSKKTRGPSEGASGLSK
ncbi:hypothetical protein [Pseudomonas sp. AIG]